MCTVGEEEGEPLFSSIKNTGEEGFFRRMWKPIAGSVLILAVLGLVGYFMPNKLGNGVDALSAGMNQEQVIKELGKPTCDFSGEIYDLSGSGTTPSSKDHFHRPNLVYQKSRDIMLVVEFGQSGTIYRWSVLETAGGPLRPEGRGENPLCFDASMGVAGVDGRRYPDKDGFEYRDWNTGEAEVFLVEKSHVFY